MEKVVGADDKVEVPLGKGEEERQNLIAFAMEILKEENDHEVLESIVDLLQNLRMNAAMKEGLKSFRKKGWPFIRESERPNDFEPQGGPTSSSRMVELEKAKLNSESRPNYDNKDNHPMNNEVIRRKIFGFFSLDDLKNFRLVSKKWYDISLSAWLGRTVLVAEKFFEDKVQRYEEHVRAMGTKQMDAEDFFEQEDATVREFFENKLSIEIPFHRYNMKFENLRGCLPDEFRTKQKKIMLDLFGSSIRELSLKCDDLDMLCLLLTKLPELRTLHVDLDCTELYWEYGSKISDDRERPLQNLPLAITKLQELKLHAYIHSLYFEADVNFPWKKIFQSAPALKYFHLDTCGRNTVTEEIIESVCEVRMENLSTLNLQDLSVFPGFLAKRIARCQFPLQRLSIDLDHDDEIDNPSWMSDLLTASAETLQYFNGGIFFDGPPSQRRLSPLAPYFPSKIKLPKLKALVLRNDCLWAFHFLSSLEVPNLEKLRILSGNYINREERRFLGLMLESDELMGSCFFPNLKEFFCDAPIDFGLAELQILAKSMPKLTHVRITKIGDETFRTAKKLWRGLQSLDVPTKGTFSVEIARCDGDRPGTVRMYSADCE